jgi:outer membrane protein assembly factor BamB
VIKTLRLLVMAFVLTGMALAQSGRTAEWVTSGADAQRSHWIPNDLKISVEALQQPGLQVPGFQFLWKSKLESGAEQPNSLTPASLMDRYIGYRGFRSFAFVAGSSNTIYALDYDLNKIEWQKRLQVSTPSSGTSGCPGGITSPIARPITTAYPFSGSVGAGRVSWARSDVGSSGEGAVTIPAALRAAAAALAPPPVTTVPATPRPPGGPRASLMYVIASDGMLHTMNVSNGDEPTAPIPFVPAQSNAQGLIVIDNFAYAVTHDCGGGHVGLWALDLATKQAIRWTPGNPSKFSGDDIAGSEAMAFGPNGTIYATTTAGSLISLSAKTLEPKESFYAAGAEFTTSPVLFSYKGRNIAAAGTRDGSIHLVDTTSLGTLLFKTAPDSADVATGALGSWQSLNGTRWLLATSSRAVTAWKIVEHDGAIALEPGWVSRDLTSPLTPMIINGVVFVVSGSPAVLHAVDGATGKTLWDSGKTITATAVGGLSGGASQIYLSTYDGTIYAFGFPIEH